MTVRIPPSSEGGSSEVKTIDFRETAPKFANSTMYKGDPMAARFGGLAVGVPGEIRGLQEAHQRWGKLPWARLVQPSVDLAAEWTVDRELAHRLQVRDARACLQCVLIIRCPSCLELLCFNLRTGARSSLQKDECCEKARLLDGRITRVRFLLLHQRARMPFIRYDNGCDTRRGYN
jgi:hypothetical protein